MNYLKLKDSIENGFTRRLSVCQKCLLATPIRPLHQTVTCGVLHKVSVSPVIHSGSIGSVRIAQLLFIGILQIGRFETRRSVQIAHDTSHGIVI